MSQVELARRLDISERRLGNYVTGLREPDLALLVRIADALKVNVDELVRPGSTSRPKGNLLIDRFLVAAETLPNAALETLVIQVEAVAARRSSERD